jgi:glycosyltransferase involved in cell wall biosynthesis
MDWRPDLSKSWVIIDTRKEVILKVVLLSGASSIHTIRWANGLNEAGQEVHVISQHEACDPFNLGVQVHQFPFRGTLGYFTMVPSVKKLLKQLQPDIVNAHYASGYATTARLAGHRPWLLSVWGSDVYDFPYKSPLHKWLVKINLLAADAVASTSHCMAEQTLSLAPGLADIHITPFGVDMMAYEAIEPVAAQAQQSLIIGTVKTMASTYGIDTLIQAFALLVKQLGEKQPGLAEKLQLRLVGGGPQTMDYKALAAQLGIVEKVSFVGRVPHDQVPQELAKLDIYVALSRQESFGVAIIEAGAAGRPVVVSDAGGLPEVTLQDKTGLVVPRENPQAAADAMQQLVLDPQLRHRFGVAGKQHVAETYSWPACVQQMVDVFQQVIKN